MDALPAYTVRVVAVAELSGISGAQIRWMREFDRWYTVAILVVLLESERERILVNTGPLAEYIPVMNAHWAQIDPRRQLRTTASLEDALHRLGVRPADITRVILTPCQAYATGNVLAFPAAEIYLAQAGWAVYWDQAAPPHPHDRPPMMFPPAVADCLRRSWGHRLHLLEGPQTVCPGVEVEPVGCHHRSSLLIQVRTAHSGWVGITDAVMLRATIAEGWPLGIAENLEECLAVLARLRRLDHAVPLYDPELDGLVLV